MEQKKVYAVTIRCTSEQYVTVPVVAVNRETAQTIALGTNQVKWLNVTHPIIRMNNIVELNTLEQVKSFGFEGQLPYGIKDNEDEETVEAFVEIFNKISVIQEKLKLMLPELSTQKLNDIINIIKS